MATPGSRVPLLCAIVLVIVACIASTSGCREQQDANEVIDAPKSQPDWGKALAEVQSGSKDTLSAWRKTLLDYQGSTTGIDYARLALEIGEAGTKESLDPYTPYSLAERALLASTNPPADLVLRTANDLNSVFEVDRANRLLEHFSVADAEGIQSLAKKLRSANNERRREAGLPLPSPSGDLIRESLLDILVAPGINVELSKYADALAVRSHDAIVPSERRSLLPLSPKDKDRDRASDPARRVDYDPVRHFEVSAKCVPRREVDDLLRLGQTQGVTSPILSRVLKATASKILAQESEKYIALSSGKAFGTQRYLIVSSSSSEKACGTFVSIDAYSASIEYADLTGDGIPELILSDYDSSDVRRLSLFVVDLLSSKLVYRTRALAMGDYFTANLNGDSALELVIREGSVGSGLVNSCIQCETSFKTRIVAYSSERKTFRTLRTVDSSSDVASDMPILRMNAEIDRANGEALVNALRAGAPKEPGEIIEPIAAMFFDRLYGDAARIASDVEASAAPILSVNPKLRWAVRAWRCRALARGNRIEQALECVADKGFRVGMAEDDESSFEYSNLKGEVALAAGDFAGYATAIKEQELLLGDDKDRVADQQATYRRIIGDSRGAANASQAAFDSAIRNNEYEHTTEPMVALVRHFAQAHNSVDAIAWLNRAVRFGRALGHDACVPALIAGAQYSIGLGYFDIAIDYLDQALMSSSKRTWLTHGPLLLRTYAMAMRKTSPTDAQSLFIRAGELGTTEDPSVAGSSYYDAAMLAKSSGAKAEAVALLELAASAVTHGRTRIDSESDKFTFLTDKRTIVEELVSSLDANQDADRILDVLEAWKVQSFLDIYFRHGSAFRSDGAGGAQYDFSSLDQQTAFVSYFLSKDGGVAVVAQREAPLRAVRLSIPDRVATDLVSKLREELDIRNSKSLSMIRSGKLSEQLQTASTTLGRELIEPLRLDGSITRLLISSDESLFGLPWPALRIRDGKWLIESASIALVPSATLANASKRRRDMVSSKSNVALVVGALGAVSSEDAAVVLGPGKGALNLSPLKYGEAEVVSVSAAFKSVERRYLLEADVAPQLVGARAAPTKVNLLEQLPKARWAHIVAHGLFGTSNPMESSIFLARTGVDGRVSAKEMLNMDLRGLDLVTLAACQTGVSGARPGGEPVGFIRALLGAGARSVVVTEWEVDDRATASLLAQTYSKLSEGDYVPDALRAAASKMSADRRHPYFWGGVSVYGAWP
ncbi:MAG: CHAT domain-containing protein [Proteobacteria bacterium]|nr:CHAT domain-containing protein [Pseudomonadota bacterium]